MVVGIMLHRAGSLGVLWLTAVYVLLVVAPASVIVEANLNVVVTSPIIPVVDIGVDVYGERVELPLVGAGTWQYNDTIAYQSVCQALEAGYTLIDTAFGYGNQKGVGMAIRDCFHGSRSDLFVMTKVPGGLTAPEVHAAHAQNLFQLGLDYVDHLMTHFPADWDYETSKTKASPAMRQEEWLALESIYYSGTTRSIGISHYCSSHIHDILKVATVRPSINQVEYHVGSGDVDQVMTTCREEGIAFMSFSPLCGPCQLSDEDDSLISGTLVTEIGNKYNKTGSQVSLRYIVQQALTTTTTVTRTGPNMKMGGVIPKSNNMNHIRSNRDIFDFTLSREDMQQLKDATKPAAEPGDCNVP
jgi:diketogulonate reductase-like aldo/keto reductase